MGPALDRHVYQTSTGSPSPVHSTSTFGPQPSTTLRYVSKFCQCYPFYLRRFPCYDEGCWTKGLNECGWPSNTLAHFFLVFEWIKFNSRKSREPFCGLHSAWTYLGPRSTTSFNLGIFSVGTAPTQRRLFSLTFNLIFTAVIRPGKMSDRMDQDDSGFRPPMDPVAQDPSNSAWSSTPFEGSPTRLLPLLPRRESLFFRRRALLPHLPESTEKLPPLLENPDSQPRHRPSRVLLLLRAPRIGHESSLGMLHSDGHHPQARIRTWGRRWFICDHRHRPKRWRGWPRAVPYVHIQWRSLHDCCVLPGAGMGGEVFPEQGSHGLM